MLHTSDWHLGIGHGPTSRAADHDRFVDWLVQAVQEHAVDALIVAGDVFDTMQPSAEALSQYYRLLSRLSAAGLPQAVIVGGNHDSAARLNAPAEVLAALRVHVVGGIGAEATWDRCVVPLLDRSGEPAAVALAVPYVHEFRLGIRTTDLDTAATRRAFIDRFSALYSELADRAQARFPGLPIVATGHLTLGRASDEDYPQAIHQVGTIDGLPDSVLDPRIRYAALGHIHRSYPVDERRRAWYSGSPIALSLPEARVDRRVLLVDLDPTADAEPRITKLPVPAPRALAELRAEPEALVRALRGLTWTEPLPPLVYARAVSDAPIAGLQDKLAAVCLTHPADRRPFIVELRVERATPLPESQVDDAARDLRELDPREVFETLCASRGIPDDPALTSAFDSLLSATSTEALQALLDQAREAGA